ncbi:hypothetical protein Tco_0242351 [Tanacetum coccineum]
MPSSRVFRIASARYFLQCLNANDQDSLNSAAGGNFLDKMPRECLKIIESKSRVRQSRSKAVVAKVSASSSTPAISSDVAELKDMVRALLLDKKNQSSATPAAAPASVKAVEQRNTQNNLNEESQSNRGNNFNQIQNRGNNFGQGPVYQPQVNQNPAYQAHVPQTQGVSQTDFERYVTANDAVIRNVQMQGQTTQNQLSTLTDMLSKLVAANTASSSGSGTLPGNTVTIQRTFKGITTEVVGNQGHRFPSSSFFFFLPS